MRARSSFAFLAVRRAAAVAMSLRNPSPDGVEPRHGAT
jgi:hypothetical protein